MGGGVDGLVEAIALTLMMNKATKRLQCRLRKRARSLRLAMFDRETTRKVENNVESRKHGASLVLKANMNCVY